MPEPTTLIRAKISADEYRRIRVEAIQRDTPVSTYVALLLREGRKSLRAKREEA